jgi:outer membrane receptor protein involved in Fe transport
LEPSINTANPSASWYPQYIYAYSEAIRAGAGGTSFMNAHLAARGVADVGRLLPGTLPFENAKNVVRSTPIPGGAKFLDKSDLWAGEAQLNFSDLMHFSDVLEIIAGVQFKQYVLKSQGTIFNDAAGPIKVNETGGYIQLKKKLGEVVTLTAAGRYDKHENYDGRFTPRFTATFKVAKNNYIRASYQQAYRFPTNQDQYINLNVGSGILIGHLDLFKSLYDVNNPNRKIYTASSVIAARTALNPTLLVVAPWNDVKPETVSSYEIGYKGVINKMFSFDAYAYRSEYKNFLSV